MASLLYVMHRPTTNILSRGGMQMENDLEQPLIPGADDSRSVDDVSLGSLDSNDPLVGRDLMTEDLARRESRAVSQLRDAVICVLLVAAFLVSAGVYITTHSSQRANFNQAFEDASSRILESLSDNLRRKLTAMDALAIDLSSLARTVQAEWPGVAMEDFEERAASTLDLADASVIMWMPIVSDKSRAYWEQYSVQHQSWIDDRIDQPQTDIEIAHIFKQRRALEANISSRIFDAKGISQGPGPFAPLWQTAPRPADIASWVNFDTLTLNGIQTGLHALMETRQAVVGEIFNASEYKALVNLLHTSPLFVNVTAPTSPIFYPVFDKSRDAQDATLVAVLTVIGDWSSYFTDTLPPSAHGIVVVLQNACGQVHTYQINGAKVDYLGAGDLHQSTFNSMHKGGGFNHDKFPASIHLNPNYCVYTVNVYPSEHMYQDFVTHNPLFAAVLVSIIFAIAALIFCTYDWLVERRQKVVLDHAMQSTAIVSALFPEQVRDRLFRRNSNDPVAELNAEETSRDDSSFVMFEPAKARLKSFLDHTGSNEDGRPNSADNKPIADLFPNCTVLFADIVGFTAWSSLRDPTQVFTMLEAVYTTFDKIARKRGVFKVETVGDSYVAVTGLPDPQEDHAVVMCRFARDCRAKMNDVTRKLELSLGPDTADLKMRFGMHSGQVTAGVLRGEKSRFQLFGDTVNTAARMESTGERDRIQLSQATADCLREAGKGHWLKARETMVYAKGKGEMQTYWFEPSNSRRSISSTASDDSLTRSSIGRSVLWGEEEESSLPDMISQRSKHMRLIDYNVDLLASLLRQVVARRRVMDMSGVYEDEEPPVFHPKSKDFPAGYAPIEEVTEVINLPEFNPNAYKGYVDPDTIELGVTVMAQLKRYVTIIAAMYRSNPFHNFEHASHVTMSVNKLLQRIAAPDIKMRRRSLRMVRLGNKEQIASDLHSYTFGITSDPLTQLAVVFAALIHDVDHWGVSNGQLVKEGGPIAQKYNNKSVAEQNSVDLAWDLLMDEEEYGDLLKCLFRSNAEYQRFRQVVVNVVLATDIYDHELGMLRKNRWTRAFDAEESDPDYGNRKATIVIEHIMQASDVAHTMQHWHVYQRWNRRLFDELYTAYKANRMERDPSTFWYEAELKFFDGYIIPLAKKLKDCGVFGVASDECLNYALNNRMEWQSKGRQIVEELVNNYYQREGEEADKAKSIENDPEKKKRQRFARRRSLFASGG